MNLQNVLSEVSNSNLKKTPLISIPDWDVKLRKTNVLVDLYTGIVKQSLLMGKWGGLIKTRRTKNSYLEKIGDVKKDIVRLFGQEDGLSVLPDIIEIFITGHKHFLTAFFQRSMRDWDNLLVCNAILRYSPLQFTNGTDELNTYRRTYLLLKREKVNDIEDFTLNVLIPLAKESGARGIILFCHYMSLWKRFYRQTLTEGEEILSYDDAIKVDVGSSEQIESIDSRIDSDRFWRCIDTSLDYIESRVIKLLFYYEMSVDEIERRTGLKRSKIEKIKESAITKLRRTEKLCEFKEVLMV